MDFKKCGINTETPSSTDSGTVISAPLAPDLQQYAKTVHFTEQQIEGFCEIAESVGSGVGVWEKERLLCEALQIIRQLQGPRIGEVRHPVDSDCEINRSRSYCYSCGTTVKDQKHCHGCGRKLDWDALSRQFQSYPTTSPAEIVEPGQSSEA